MILKIIIILYLFFLLFSFIPIDLTLKNYIGPPKIIPTVYGKPSLETIEASERGEVYLIGCIVSGFEPKWVVVW